MGFVDKIKGGLEKAKEEAGDFAQITKIKREIGRLDDRKTELFVQIGQRVYALQKAGSPPEGFGASCQEIATLEEQIRGKEAEIERVRETKGPKSGATGGA